MRLEWDKTGEKSYETGLDHGVLYKQDENGDYTTGEVWNGLTAVNESPGGAEATDIYADNIKYGTLRSAETFGATVEAYTYPKGFEECDGSKEVTPGVFIGQQDRKPFGLSYRTEIHNDTATSNDDGYKLHLIYGATASPSEKSRATINESPEAMSMSWEITTTPVNVTGYKPTATLIIDSRFVDKEKLKEFEDILYGTNGNVSPISTFTDEDEDGDGEITSPTNPVTGGTEPRLPHPDEVIAFFNEGSANTFGIYGK